MADLRAPYDAIADWYEHEFLSGLADDPLRIRPALRDLLGAGTGICVEIGCGTGAYAAEVRELGWRPVGVDLSAGMLATRGTVCPSHRRMRYGCRSATPPSPLRSR